MNVRKIDSTTPVDLIVDGNEYVEMRDESNRLRAALQQVYDFGHLTTLEYTSKYPGDTRHRSEIMRAALAAQEPRPS